MFPAPQVPLEQETINTFSFNRLHKKLLVGGGGTPAPPKSAPPLPLILQNCVSPTIDNGNLLKVFVLKRCPLSRRYGSDFLLALATRHPQSCSATHMKPVVPNICNMLQKVKFNKYSATFSQLFCCRACLWLYVQHSGFRIPATSERSVVLPV